MKKSIAITSFVLLIAGCWTFDETRFPDVQMTSAESNAKTVKIVGFAAQRTEWEAVHSYRTFYIPGRAGYNYYECSHFETVPSVDYVPQRRTTDMYLRRAQDLFEKAGFILAPTDPAYTVDVSFDGPFAESGDELRRFAWNVLTLFFCDSGATRWTASLRIRETKTGKLVFHRDYEQNYETRVFSPIPIFGAASCNATDIALMQHRCLSALTDRICADATAFVAGKGE